jgi:hypothetical protein
LRAVVSARRCRADERPLKGNVRGPQGEPGTGLESFDALAGLGCTVGSTSGTIAIDYDATSGEAHIRCVVAPPPPALVRVNEFSTGTEGALANEFIELVNTGTEPAELSGYKLVYRSATGTSDVSLGTLPDATTLAGEPSSSSAARAMRGPTRRTGRSRRRSLPPEAGSACATPRARSSTPLPGVRRRTPSSKARSPTLHRSSPLPGRAPGGIPTATIQTTIPATSRSWRCQRPAPPTEGVAVFGLKRRLMKDDDKRDPRVSAIMAALSLNRGELDPLKLEHLLKLLDSATAKATA